eukprot:COSAG01_NODE_585_length_15160_cov_15.779473_4_plen_171_part_00
MARQVPSRHSARPARTSIWELGYDTGSNTALVLCRPHTGRTHQIRVHLQWLGAPIANDPNYGPPATAAAAAAAEARVASADRDSACAAASVGDVDDGDDDDEMVIDGRRVGIWLHAYAHAGCCWGFRSGLPRWAKGTFDSSVAALHDGATIEQAIDRIIARSSTCCTNKS